MSLEEVARRTRYPIQHATPPADDVTESSVKEHREDP